MTPVGACASVVLASNAAAIRVAHDHAAPAGLKPCATEALAGLKPCATVAARLGTVREEISRALNRMQRNGILNLSRQEITVLDLAALERVTYE